MRSGRFAPLNFDSNVTTDDAKFYHRADPARLGARGVSLSDRQFIAWDGEGARDKDNPHRQSYVLLGNSTGAKMVSEELHTEEMLRFIIQQGRENPGAWHVGFAFDYDVNMILRNLSPGHFRQLRLTGHVKYKEKYRIEHIPAKWLQVTEYGPNHATDKRDRVTVRICDTFGFFQSSFLKAIKSYIPTSPLMVQLDVIKAGKAKRNEFTYDQIDYITRYWWVEIQLMQELVEKLRELLYDVDLTISQWHGPGALANFAYKRYGIKTVKQVCPGPVYDAARFAYAGGRFERFHIGRYRNGFGLDINSAYPYGISQLPDLTEGTWVHRTLPDIDSIVEFGVYHVRLIGSPVMQKPSPLFHRDATGSISYPWLTEGWYWSPEIALLRNLPGVEILEGWEYVGWETRPFLFVADIYAERRELKKLKIGSEKALKLLLNSLYGKMAQRVGWERSGGPPTWHQLEWAGWVTSATRAKLFGIMSRIPFDQLIAVETDGIYTTASPKSLGISHSTELGGWEVSPFDEIRYVQSGMYAKGHEGKWETKYRGLDAKSITPLSIRRHLRELEPNVTTWPVLTGPTTRFVGYRQALWRESMNMGPMKAHLGKWETTEKDLSAGSSGKRVHSSKLCAACKEGLNAWDMPHDTVIRSRSLIDPVSKQHDIPWLDHDTPEWRLYEESMR